jgi:hypothetical protein
MSSTAPTPLSTVFSDDWYKFTTDTIEPATVATILNARFAPSNSPHKTNADSLEKASQEFIAENGDALKAALEHLKR